MNNSKMANDISFLHLLLVYLTAIFISHRLHEVKWHDEQQIIHSKGRWR